MKYILLLSLFLFTLHYAYPQKSDSTIMQKKTIEQVFKEHQQELLILPGVQGFYQSLSENGEKCIVIMVDAYSESLKKSIPDTLEGYPVVIEAVGEIKPLKNQDRKKSPEE